MQLVATGAQDLYLTSNPEVTWFRSLYKRYTPFALEDVEQVFNGQVRAGSKVSATISRNGDLLTNLFLEVQLTWDGTANMNDVYYPAEAIIKEVELEIGGSRIDRIPGDWFRVRDELFRKDQEKKAYQRMTNFTDEDMAGSGVFEQYTGNVNIKRRFFLQLPFWFCNDTGLSLPLIALQFHEVRVNLTFNDSVPGLSMADKDLDVKLYAQYAMLDTTERKTLASSNQEYLITQLQYSGSENVDAFTTAGTNTKNVRLAFNHPVSMLAWVVKGDKHGWYNVARPFAATGGTKESSVYNDVYAPLLSAKLQLNGHDTFAERPGSYFNQVQPFQFLGTRPSAGIYMYSFSLDPSKTSQPSGSCNFSRIDNATLSLTFKQASSQDSASRIMSPEHMAKDSGNLNLRSLIVFAVNYNVLRILSGMGGLAFSN